MKRENVSHSTCIINYEHVFAPLSSTSPHFSLPPLYCIVVRRSILSDDTLSRGRSMTRASRVESNQLLLPHSALTPNPSSNPPSTPLMTSSTNTIAADRPMTTPRHSTMTEPPKPHFFNAAAGTESSPRRSRIRSTFFRLNRGADAACAVSHWSREA